MKSKKNWVIKRDLTLDNVPTDESNSYWISVKVGWGSEEAARRRPFTKSLAQRGLNVHHSTRWYTKKAHAYLYQLPDEEETVSEDNHDSVRE